MNFSLLSLLTAAAVVFGSPVPRSLPDGVVSLPISKEFGTGSSLNRRNTYPTKLEHEIFQYVAEFGLGSPPQKVKAAIDTGSSDLWVYSSSVVPSHSYNAKKSFSYRLLEKNGFSIYYVSGSAKGDWVKDTITWGGATIKGQQFAVSNSAASGINDYGVFGIAFKSSESSKKPYDNFPYSLKANGLVARNAYSLYLNSPSATDGELLFGGIDRSRYTGTLKTVPLTRSDSFSVPYKFSGYSYNQAILDSGTSLVYVPREAWNKFVRDYGFKYTSTVNGVMLNGAPTGDDVVFNIGGVDITMPIESAFIDLGNGQYMFGIQPSEYASGYNLLGDVLLRYAYVVYDLENRQVAIAPANLNPGASDVIAIPAGTAIPGSS